MIAPLLYSRGFIKSARNCLPLRIASYTPPYLTPSLSTTAASAGRNKNLMTDTAINPMTSTSHLTLGTADEGYHDSLLTPGRFSQGKYRKFHSTKAMATPSSSDAPEEGSPNSVVKDLSNLKLEVEARYREESTCSSDTDSSEGGVSLLAPQPVATTSAINIGEPTAQHGSSTTQENKKKEKNNKKKNKKKKKKEKRNEVKQAAKDSQGRGRPVGGAPINGKLTPCRLQWRMPYSIQKRDPVGYYRNRLPPRSRFSNSPMWHEFELDRPAGTPSNQRRAASPRSAAPPTPTEAYMEAVKKPLSALRVPSTLLVILDLNGTLLFRNRQKAVNVQRASANPDLRPHLIPFLDYLFSNFYVMIWSSATPQNVQRMATACFTKQQLSILVACWGRDTLGLAAEDYRAKVITYKRLNQVFDGVRIPGLPAFDHTNTVLVDDSAIKAQSHPFNHIEIPDYDEELHKSGSDNALAEVAGYLDHLKWANSVASFIYNSPFKLGSGLVAPWLRT